MKLGTKKSANLVLLLFFIIFIGTFFINLPGIWGQILKRAAEAALIGGIADWFAVTALFKHPFNLSCIPHTNIIENNKNKIIDGVTRIVNEKWLSKEFLGKEINKIDFYDVIEKSLKKDKYNKKIRFNARKYMIKFLKYSKTEKFNKYLLDLINRTLDSADLAAKISNGIVAFLESKDFDKTYDMLAVRIKNYIAAYDSINLTEITDLIKIFAEKSINDNFDNAMMSLCDFTVQIVDENKSSLKEKIVDVINKYKENTFLRELAVYFAQKTNILNIENLSDEIIAEIKNFVIDIKNNPSNAVRLEIKKYALNKLNIIETLFYQNLDTFKDYISNYIDSYKGKNLFKNKLLNIIKLDETSENKILKQFDKQIKGWIVAASLNIVKTIIDNNNIYIFNKSLFKEKFDYVISLILREAENKKTAINLFFREKTVYAMKVNHSIIGKLVRGYLESLDNKELVAQIESKIGNDLQYIRINGALVGSLVGIAIAIITFFLK
ncbi:MAG: DUF445 domain-containing protein [Deltaproteobacteria bacterium]|jgi:uncharacterized membrane-anchored protein YjiN (DUF445 family)|nr:DUF445 domain-containing protein [Deltaproteobacteria bacterium]MCL5880352.1 DUF445 domain-containing protein [Deltaproteobacteria bacterium]MDA8303609.1 DUF445 domain-containing protein [Deltaproteobacteria bacterium]